MVKAAEDEHDWGRKERPGGIGGAAIYIFERVPELLQSASWESEREVNKQTNMQSLCRTVFFLLFFPNQLLILADQHMEAHMGAYEGAYRCIETLFHPNLHV